LEGLGLAVPRWVAFAQERAWGFACREVLAVAAMPGVQGLAQWQRRSASHNEAGSRELTSSRRGLAEALGREVGRAHAAGFWFRRFSAQDVGVRARAGGKGLEPVLLSVGAGGRRRRLPQRKRLGDLVSLAACFPGPLTATEMLHFFRGYLGRPLTSADKELVRAAMRRYRKAVRGGRPSGARSA
jgi:hypothetical protein